MEDINKRQKEQQNRYNVGIFCLFYSESCRVPVQLKGPKWGMGRGEGRGGVGGGAPSPSCGRAPGGKGGGGGGGEGKELDSRYQLGKDGSPRLTKERSWEE